MNTPERHELEKGGLRASQGTTPLPTPEPAPTRRRKWRLGLGLLVVLLLISSYLPFDTLWVLTTGWFTYGLRVGSQLGQHWQGLAGGLALAVLSFYSLHAVLRRLHRGRRETASPDSPAANDAPQAAFRYWPWKTTGIMLVLLMMTTAFTLCAGAILHQVGWLLRQDRWSDQRPEPKPGTQLIRSLWPMVEELQQWHEEQIPETLAVYRTGEFLVQARTMHDLWNNSDYAPSPEEMPGMWLPDGTPDNLIPVEGVPYKSSDELDWPLLVSTYDHHSGLIMVASTQSKVRVMNRDQWRGALEQWRPKFAEHGVPWPSAFDVLGR